MGRLSINLCDCSWFASPPGPSWSLLIRTKRYTSPCTFPSCARTQLPCPPPPGDLDHTPVHATRLPAGVLGYFSLATCWSFFSPGIRGVVTGLSGYVALRSGVLYRVHSTFVPLTGRGASFCVPFFFCSCHPIRFFCRHNLHRPFVEIMGPPSESRYSSHLLTSRHLRRYNVKAG